MTARAQLRAALLAVALLAHGIYALPLPRPLSPRDLESDQAQADLERWSAAFGAAGVEVEPDEVGRVVVRLTRATGELHRGLKAPFAPVFDLFGINQSWALFVSATLQPDRLVVEIQREGSREWEPVLRRLDPCCTWLEDEIRFRRVRGVWDGQENAMRPGYRGLTKWIARRAFADHPDARRVRVRLERATSTYPWEEPVTEVVSRHPRIHGREVLTTFIAESW